MTSHGSLKNTSFKSNAGSNATWSLFWSPLFQIQTSKSTICSSVCKWALSTRVVCRIILTISVSSNSMRMASCLGAWYQPLLCWKLCLCVQDQVCLCCTIFVLPFFLLSKFSACFSVGCVFPFGLPHDDHNGLIAACHWYAMRMGLEMQSQCGAVSQCTAMIVWHLTGRVSMWHWRNVSRNQNSWSNNTNWTDDSSFFSDLTIGDHSTLWPSDCCCVITQWSDIAGPVNWSDVTYKPMDGREGVIGWRVIDTFYPLGGVTHKQFTNQGHQSGVWSLCNRLTVASFLMLKELCIPSF